MRYELNKFRLKPRPKSPAMPQAVSRGPRTADIRIRTQARGRESCRRKNGTRTDFFPSTSVFPSQCHSTSVPYSSPLTCFSYEDKWAKPGNLPQESPPGNRGALHRAVFLNRRAAARYRALASIIPGRERFCWNLSF